MFLFVSYIIVRKEKARKQLLLAHNSVSFDNFAFTVVSSLHLKLIIKRYSFGVWVGGHILLTEIFLLLGDEVGESEPLGEALPIEPSVAKAERSHLIVWQVMCGSE